MAKLNEIPVFQLKQIIANSNNLAEVLKKLQITDNGYNRSILKDIITSNTIDITHFLVLKKPLTKEEYNKNPKYCKNCGKVIPYEKRMNDFCDSSCSASLNNKKFPKKQGQITKLDLISDEDFINIINRNHNWKTLSKDLGYTHIINSNIKNKVLIRCAKLNIDFYLITETIDWDNLTKKEIFDKSCNWQSARTTIRKHAVKVFEEANKQYKCAICGYDLHCDVAHIKAVSDFSDNATLSEINNPDNLIALCPNHHWEYDHGILKL